MPHYLRFIVTDERDFSLALLHDGLRAADPAWSLADPKPGLPATAELRWADQPLALLELDLPGVDIFKEELAELIEIAANEPGAHQSVVLLALRKARALLALEVRWADREPEETHALLAKLFAWLFQNRKGLQHEDGVGFSDSTGVILAIR